MMGGRAIDACFVSTLPGPAIAVDLTSDFTVHSPKPIQRYQFKSPPVSKTVLKGYLYSERALLYVTKPKMQQCQSSVAKFSVFKRFKDPSHRSLNRADFCIMYKILLNFLMYQCMQFILYSIIQKRM